jgi:type IX secretion system PorP/SprF family membrane protein
MKNLLRYITSFYSKGIITLMFSFGIIIQDISAQQDPNFSMYMMNNMYFNPAYVGTADFITGSLFYRNQWAGFNSAPVVQNLSLMIPFPRHHFGLGLNVFNDKLGINGSINANLAFAYYLNLKNGKLSFGLDLGLKNSTLNYDQLNINDKTDQAFSTSNTSKMNPDFGFGMYYKALRYYAGISISHLNGAGLSYTGYKSGDQTASIARHYYLTGGYNIEINEDFLLTPSILCAYSESKVFSNNISSNITLKLEYRGLVWGGLGYRSSDAINIFTGLNVGKINPDIFKENIKIGYCFDLTTGQLPGYNSGTNELFISYSYTPVVKRTMPKFK